MTRSATGPSVSPPDPGRAQSLDDLTALLRELKIWAGNPSYGTIRDRINADWRRSRRPHHEAARKSTVAYCFQSGRRRLNTDLVLAVVTALHPDLGYVAQWRQVLRFLDAETQAADQVRAQDVLPADPTGFTGRHSELSLIRDLVNVDDATAAPVVTVEGMAGVGKTYLAVRAGHLLTRERPVDHVLFVNLRGCYPDADQPPADPGAVLDGFLRLLRTPTDRIPPHLDSRVALYRQQLRGRRVLVVLDDAADEDQIRPLLQDVPGCLTILTSRHRLTALGPVLPVRLDVFSSVEAKDMLTAAAPKVPVGADPEALDRLAVRCGHLPLALGLVAGQMRTRDGWTLTDHADRLDERHDRGLLDTGVELALELSYRHLPESRRQLFRSLAGHPGTDVDDRAAAALAGVVPGVAAGHLAALAADHLLHETAPGRFVLHDLVRAYATDRAAEEDPRPVRRAALARLCDYYLATAAAAMDSLVPSERHARPGVPASSTPPPRFADAAAARRWMDLEQANLTAITAKAAGNGWTARVTGMAAVLFRYLDSGNHYGTAGTLHTLARDAARAAGDRTGEARATTDLATVHIRLGAYRSAIEHLRRALELLEPDGDTTTRSRILGNLGVAHERLGSFAEAAEHHQRALELFREMRYRTGQARALTNLGIVYERLGRYAEASDRLHRALELAREVGDPIAEAGILDQLGYVCRRMGAHDRALAHHRRSLALSENLGSRSGQAAALNNLGATYQRLGRHDEAAAHHTRALTLLRDIGDSTFETETLNDLGETLLAGGRTEQATAHHTEALTRAEHLGDRYQEGRAHCGLARVRQATGHHADAEYHWERALTLYGALDVPEACAVRERLSALRDSRKP